MRDMNFAWCFEGGCTFADDSGTTLDNEADMEELEALYREPCIGMAD